MYPFDLTAKARRVRRQTMGFGGLDRTARAAENALGHSEGLSFDRFPCLATRRGRVPARQTQEGSDLFAWGKLCTVEGTTLYYDGEAVGTVTPGRKQFAVVNTKLCVFPDKKYLDLTTREFGDLAAKVTNRHALQAVFSENGLWLEPDTDLGEQEHFSRNIRPKMNTTDHRTESGIYHFLKVYDSVSWDEDTGAWTKEGERELWMMDNDVLNQVGKYVILAEPSFAGGRYMNMKKVKETRRADGVTVHNTIEVLADYEEDSKTGLYGIIKRVKLEHKDYLYYGESFVDDVTITLELHNAGAGNQGFEGRFFPGDRVYISGCTLPENNTPEGQPLTVESVSGHTLSVLAPKGAQAAFTPRTETGTVTVERRVPDLDFICEGDNRLFGVSNADGMAYASALGDPRNFEAFDGLGSDSWRQRIGSAGDFTGCVALGGSVLFWKEECLHKLMGSRPSAYQLYTYHIDGLEKGSERSMVILSDTLYYKGRNGVYAYAGSVPRLVSADLGHVSYDQATAGGSGEIYRVSMRRRDTGEWELLSYHTGEKAWLREGQMRADAFARLEGTLYALSDGVIYALDQGEDDDGAAIAWEATLAPWTEDDVAWKYPCRLLVELELSPGAWAEVQLAQDGGAFQSLWTGHAAGASLAVVPVRPGRCRGYQLRLRGEGACVIRSVTREFTWGGVK